MARTKNTVRKHPLPAGATALPRATYPVYVASDPNFDPTARRPTRPTLPGAKKKPSASATVTTAFSLAPRVVSPGDLPVMTPPPPPISPLPSPRTFAPDLRQPLSPPTSPPLQYTPSLPPTPRKTKRKKSSTSQRTESNRSKKHEMKEMMGFIRRLKRLNPDMVYADLVKNVGSARLGLLQWFKLAAMHLLKGNIKPLHAQHKKWVENNRDVLEQLTNNIPVTDKLALVMKPGGQGFFGGILIRILVRWKERLEKEREKKRGHRRL